MVNIDEYMLDEYIVTRVNHVVSVTS